MWLWLALAGLVGSGDAFRPSGPRAGLSVRGRPHAGRGLCAAPEDETADLYASLGARALVLEGEDRAMLRRWRDGKCVSKVLVALEGDWIRRCAYDGFSCAFGTASGSVGVLRDFEETCTSLPARSAVGAHAAYVEGQDASVLGDYDGGGVTAISLRGGTLATGGREGSVKVWRVDADALTLLQTFRVGSLISSLAISTDATQLFATGLDGSISKFAAEGADWNKSDWAQKWRVEGNAAAVCCGFHERRNVVAAGFGNGEVRLFDATDGRAVSSFSAHSCAVRSLVFEQGAAALFTGSVDGEIRRHVLGDSHDRAREDKLKRVHGGPVVALAMRDGVLCSGSVDGTLRVWELVRDGPPKVRYGMAGFKVWMGSVACDDRRLLSDGSDNAIIVHDFGAEAP
ncbi:WD40-repeat-containing domain protein [Pelagophyceae sp. CCMP2097]|nr:WD40-repeat-containing domain protein [Pelagophyceae sp. CCMP2097]